MIPQKIYPSHLLFIFLSNTAPITPPIKTPAATAGKTTKSTSPENAYINPLVSATGKITAMQLACAALRSYFKSFMSIGTITIPPPPPKNPFKNPPSAPTPISPKIFAKLKPIFTSALFLLSLFLPIKAVCAILSSICA